MFDFSKPKRKTDKKNVLAFRERRDKEVHIADDWYQFKWSQPIKLGEWSPVTLIVRANDEFNGSGRRPLHVPYESDKSEQWWKDKLVQVINDAYDRETAGAALCLAGLSLAPSSAPAASATSASAASSADDDDDLGLAGLSLAPSSSTAASAASASAPSAAAASATAASPSASTASTGHWGYL